MLNIQVIPAKKPLKKHKKQCSQPNLMDYQNLNSFDEYFKQQSKNKEKQGKHIKRLNIFELRCKTEANLLENNVNYTQMNSNQSTTTCSLSNNKTNNGSLSPRQRFTKQIDSSNNKKRHAFKSSVAPFQEEELLKNKVQQSDLEQIAIKAKQMLDQYQKRELKYKSNQLAMQQEIQRLKAKIEKQNKLLIKHYIKPL